MNIHEAIEKIEKRKSTLNGWEELTRNNALDDAIDIVKKIDEPEKPVVPQFVADWYEEHKDNFEFNVQCLCVHSCQPVREIDIWFDSDDNKPIETLVMMHKFGYEVEKESLYTVRFSSEYLSNLYIGIHRNTYRVGLSVLPVNDEQTKSWFTEWELKKFNFWENPAFIVDKVK